MAELAYSFRALDARRTETIGVLLASDYDDAVYRLKSVGLQEARLRLSILATLRGWLSPRFAARDLALFYRTLADRLASEVPLVEAIESSSEFVRDARLGQAIRMTALTARASSLHRALRSAGFPEADCNLLDAVAASAQSVDTLKAMAERIEREVALKRSIVQTLLPSMISVAVLCGFFWAFVVFFAPEYFRFFTERGFVDRMTPWVRAVYETALVAGTNKALFSAAYVTAIGGIVLAAASGRLARLLFLVPGVASLVERWEHLRLWSAFRVMARADIVLQRIFGMLSAAASLPATRSSFDRAVRLAEGGTPLAEIVARVGFPDYIVRYVKASAPGRLDDALRRLTSSLEFDAELVASRVKWMSTMAGFVSVTVALVLCYRVTYIEVFYLLRKMVS